MSVNVAPSNTFDFTITCKTKCGTHIVDEQKPIANEIIGFYTTNKNDKWAFMSNFYPCEFKVQGILFTSAEHYIMYQKAVLMGNRDIADAILLTKSPSDAKALGRRVMPFDQSYWNKHKKRIVKDALRLKFNNQDLCELLLATGQAILVEGSPTDRVWGAGLPVDHPHIMDPARWRGQNLLGKCLMEIREELKKKKPCTK